MGEWNGTPYNIFIWILFGVATAFVATRLYVQFSFRYRPWGEAFVIAAWVLYLVTNICSSILNHLGYYNDGWNSNPLAPKINYVWAFTWMVSMFACKGALMCFYFELAPRHVLPRMWWTIVGVSIFVGTGAAYHILSLFLDCWPFELNWAEQAHCNFDAGIILTSMSFHLATDVAVYAVPFLLLGNLSMMSWRDKAGAVAMASLGLFSVIAATIQLVFYAELLTSYGRSITIAAAAYLIEMQPPIAIMIVCAPQVRRLWRGVSEEAIRAEKEKREGAAIRRQSTIPDLEASAESSIQRTVSGSGSTDDSKSGMAIVNINSY